MMSKVDEEGIKTARAGIVFKDLTIRGTGSALNLQKNVGSFFMTPFRIKEHVSFGRNKPSKTILHSFDGLLKSGELLIVLGRPGSGCSTLLKTLMGMLHGLEIAEESTGQWSCMMLT
jgi:ATP-binding cassette subfamily G (WHITE) protein 2 (PDR)